VSWSKQKKKKHWMKISMLIWMVYKSSVRAQLCHLVNNEKDC
jgi:hypothetical protein